MRNVVPRYRSTFTHGIFIITLCVITGCSDTDNSEGDCEEPTLTDVEIIGLRSASNYTVESTNNEGITILAEHDGSTPTYTDYVLGVQADITSVANAKSQNIQNILGQLFIRTAIASCPPPGRLNVSVSGIESLEITSNKPMGDDYPIGATLNRIFGITALTRVEEGRGLFIENIESMPTVESFLSTSTTAPIFFYLKLLQSPETQEEHVFSISYILQNGASFSVNTVPVVIGIEA